MAALGHGGLKEGQIVNKLVEEYEKKNKKEMTDAQVLEAISSGSKENKESKVKVAKSESAIVVKGIHDVAVRFSRCCSPVPGDEIVGFVTRGRGVSIHRTDCINMINLPEIDRARMIDAEWQETAGRSNQEHYQAEIKLIANNRTGILADISRILTERQIDVKSLNSRTSKQGIATINMAFEIQGKEELNRLVDKLRNVESIIDIERTSG